MQRTLRPHARYKPMPVSVAAVSLRKYRLLLLVPLTALEVPFQVLDVASGDLGLSAARKFDCYAWLPTQERYREVTSTSIRRPSLARISNL